MISSPRLPVQASMDVELKEIMRRQRRVVDGERRLSTTSIEASTSAEVPKKIDQHVLDQFEPSGDPRIDEIRERVKNHFTMISKNHEELKNHFHEIAEEQDPHLKKSGKKSNPLSFTDIVISEEGNAEKPTIEVRVDYSNNAVETYGNTIKVENVSMVDTYGVSGKYSGQFYGNKPHGLGTMKYNSGTMYKGEWQYDKWHGKGLATFATGDTFEGTHHMDKRVGFGLYKWQDGRTYEGEFQSDKRHGWGTYKWSDGSTYCGEFSNGRRNGVGTYSFVDGSVYKGEFLDGLFHGVGEMQWNDGRFYQGDWNSGKAHGKGLGKRADGSVLHDGEWTNNVPAHR